VVIAAGSEGDIVLQQAIELDQIVGSVIGEGVVALIQFVDEPVMTETTVQRVVSIAALKLVIPQAAEELIVIALAEEQIITVTAVEHVLAVATLQFVVKKWTPLVGQ